MPSAFEFVYRRFGDYHEHGIDHAGDFKYLMGFSQTLDSPHAITAGALISVACSHRGLEPSRTFHDSMGFRHTRRTQPTAVYGYFGAGHTSCLGVRYAGD